MNHFFAASLVLSVQAVAASAPQKIECVTANNELLLHPWQLVISSGEQSCPPIGWLEEKKFTLD